MANALDEPQLHHLAISQQPLRILGHTNPFRNRCNQRVLENGARLEVGSLVRLLERQARPMDG